MKVKSFSTERRVILALVALFLGWLFAVMIPFDYPVGKDWNFMLPGERLQKQPGMRRPYEVPVPVGTGTAEPVKNPEVQAKFHSQWSERPLKSIEDRNDKRLPHRAAPGSTYIMLDNAKLGKNTETSDPVVAQAPKNRPSFEEGAPPKALTPTENEGTTWTAKGAQARRDEEIKQLARELETDAFLEPDFQKTRPLFWDDIKPKLKGSEPAVKSVDKEKIAPSEAKPDSSKMDEPTNSTEKSPPPKRESLPVQKKSSDESGVKESGSAPEKKKESQSSSAPSSSLVLHPIDRSVEPAPGSFGAALRSKDPLPTELTRIPLNEETKDLARQNPQGESSASRVVMIPSTLPSNDSRIVGSSHTESVVKNSDVSRIKRVPDASRFEGEVVYLRPSGPPDPTSEPAKTSDTVPQPAGPAFPRPLKLHVIQRGETLETLARQYQLRGVNWDFFMQINRRNLGANGQFPIGTRVFIP